MDLLLLLFVSLFRPAHEGLEAQIAQVTREIEAEPRKADLYLKRAELHRLHEDWAAAKADYDRTSALDPAQALVDLGRGRMWLVLGDAKEAKRHLDLFLGRRPEHGEGYVERARSLLRLGRRPEAAADYTRALERLEKPTPEVYLERAQALRDEGPARWDEAVRGLDEGIRKLGPVVTLRLLAIDLEVDLKRYDAALARVDEIAQRSERKDPWLVRRAEVLRLAGRSREARDAFAAALALIETLPPSRRAAGFTRDLEKRARAGLEVMDGKP